MMNNDEKVQNYLYIVTWKVLSNPNEMQKLFSSLNSLDRVFNQIHILNID